MASGKIGVCPRFALAALLLAAPLAHAQDPAASYPSGRSASSGRERAAPPIISRVISAQRLQERWGQPVIVDSRAGAGGTIPTDVVAKSPPDGTTW